MPIFRNSRYAKTPVHKRDGVLCFKTRKRFKFPTENATMHLFQEERLDGLALRYYGDSQLRWVILDANPLSQRIRHTIRYRISHTRLQRGAEGLWKLTLRS